jgi:hypothetical protein
MRVTAGCAAALDDAPPEAGAVLVGALVLELALQPADNARPATAAAAPAAAHVRDVLTDQDSRTPRTEPSHGSGSRGGFTRLTRFTWIAGFGLVWAFDGAAGPGLHRASARPAP